MQSRQRTGIAISAARLGSILVATIAILVGALMPIAHAATPITMPDANLRVCINDSLGQAPTDDILVSQAASMSVLDCAGRDIEDLAGIEMLTGLTRLYLQGNSDISDLAPLSTLTGLTLLNLTGLNQVSDVSPLAGLTNLETLFLQNIGLTDISALNGFTNMKDFRINGNSISDISVVATMPDLEALTAFMNAISDLSPLTGLNSIKQLWLYSNEISDLTPLENLTTLEHLWLQDNQIEDISPLVGLQGLQPINLRLAKNRIVDASPLASVNYRPNLAQLLEDQWINLGDFEIGQPVANPVIDIDGSPIPLDTLYDPNSNTFTPTDPGFRNIPWAAPGNDFSGILRITGVNTPIVSIPDANLKACINDELGQAPAADITVPQAATVEHLECWAEGVESLEGLQHFTALEQLRAGHNEIDDLGPLSNLTSLRELSLDWNIGLADVSPLAGLVNLEVLWLSENLITDLTPLAGLTELTTLGLWENYPGIEDVSPLSNLTKLEYLYLGDNQKISDISPLSNLTSLVELSLEYNNISDVGPLAAMVNLDQAWLHNNEIDDLNPLVNLTSLTRLNLSSNEISDVTPLTGLVNLSDLRLLYNNIADLSPLGSIDFTILDARGQNVYMGDIEVDVPQANPILGLDGLPRPLGNSPTEIAGTDSFTRSDEGAGTLEWFTDGVLEFSGTLHFNVIPASGGGDDTPPVNGGDDPGDDDENDNTPGAGGEDENDDASGVGSDDDSADEGTSGDADEDALQATGGLLAPLVITAAFALMMLGIALIYRRRQTLNEM